MSEPYAPAVLRGEPTSPPLPGERGYTHTALDLKMEALAHAVHLAVKVVESRAMREEPADYVIAAAERFERYLTSPPIDGGSAIERAKTARDPRRRDA